MGPRFTNAAVLVLAVTLTLTGVYGLFSQLSGLALDLHRVAAWMLVLLFPWKALISYRSLRRGPARSWDRSVVLVVSAVLGVATLAVVVWSIGWMWRFGADTVRLVGYRDTAIAWHWMVGLATLPALALHAWRRWPSPRKSDLLSRRGLLRAAALGAAGLLVWRAGKSVALLRSAGVAASLTGAREAGSFSGNSFPVTTGAGDGQLQTELADWRLEVFGAVDRPLSLTYAQISELATQEWQARLDCTIGWYTDQVWRGPSLSDVLARAGVLPEAASVRLIAQGGNSMAFPIGEVRRILLATHVGTDSLSHEHGFPMRVVAPSYRGWHWIKWLHRINVIPIREI